MELTRGQVTDRPWGATLYALGSRELTGRLIVTPREHPFTIAFARGAIVDARSAAVGDSVLRIAIVQQLVPAHTAASLQLQLQRNSELDEVEHVAKVAELSTDDARLLRRAVIAQRASRTFELESGEFSIETGPIAPPDGIEIDVRSVILRGARHYISPGRLAADLRALGQRFRLRPDVELAAFGFTPDEEPILAQLRGGASLAELESLPFDPRVPAAVLYTVVVCGVCEVIAASSPRPSQPPPPAEPVRDGTLFAIALVLLALSIAALLW